MCLYFKQSQVCFVVQCIQPLSGTKRNGRGHKAARRFDIEMAIMEENCLGSTPTST
jgi:hypothetical protein